MERLKNKSYKTYDYISRYSSIPYYYNEKDDKYIFGLTSYLEENVTFVLHTLKDYDTLELLALTYYGRPDLYWVIADFNKILDPFIHLQDKFTTIKIPTLTNIYYKG